MVNFLEKLRRLYTDKDFIEFHTYLRTIHDRLSVKDKRKMSDEDIDILSVSRGILEAIGMPQPLSTLSEEEFDSYRFYVDFISSLKLK